MTVEDAIRRVLTEDADATTWSIEARDVVDHTPLVDVTPLAARRRHPIVLGAVAAVTIALIGIGTFLVQRSRQSTISAGQADELTGMTLLLPKFSSDSGYKVADAVAAPKGWDTAFAPGAYLVILTDGVSRAISVISHATTGAAQASRTIDLRGTKALANENGPGFRNVMWAESGQTYLVETTSNAPETDLVAVAESVRTNGSTFTVTAPNRFSVVFEGHRSDFQPAWAFQVHYTKENLDQPHDEDLAVSVIADGPAADVQDLVGSTDIFDNASREDVDVGGRTAKLFRATPAVLAERGLAATTELRMHVAGAWVDIIATGVSDNALLAFARRLEPVDPATFRVRLGSKLQVFNADALLPVSTTVATVPEDTVTFRGSDPFAGPITWSAASQCLGLGPPENQASNCGGSPTIQVVLRFPSTVVDVWGLIDGAPATVVVRDADSKVEVGRARAMQPDRPIDQRGFVLTTDAADATGTRFEAIGLGPDGTPIGPPVAVPSLSDIYQRQQAEQQARDAQSKPGAVLLKGEFEGRPWVLHDDPNSGHEPRWENWTMSFAGSPPTLLELNIAPLPPVAGFDVVLSASSRRRFVVALVSGDVDTVTATFTDGKTQRVKAESVGGFRVVVFGFGKSKTLQSLTAIATDGREIGTKAAELAGSDDLNGGITGTTVPATAVPSAAPQATPRP
jgi:hypothetical protein